MPILKNKNLRLLGVDFGSATIKLVEIEHSNSQSKLITYGIAERDYPVAKMDSYKDQKLIAEILEEVVARSHATSNKVITAISALNAFNTIVELPSMPAKEIKSAIQWEAKKIVPLQVEKMILDWQVIPETLSNDKNKKIKVILTAAPKDVINGYVNIFKNVDLSLIGIETELSALRRSLVAQDTGTYLVIDIGATNTNMVIFSNNIPQINRNIDIGSKTITQNIANSMSISDKRAEQFRDDIGLPDDGQINHPVSKSIAFIIDNMIAKEIRRLTTIFQQNSNTSVEKIILIGGCAHLKNLTKYLTNLLKIDTSVGDPWKQIAYPKELSASLAQIGPQMAVSIGLALKKNI